MNLILKQWKINSSLEIVKSSKEQTWHFITDYLGAWLSWNLTSRFNHSGSIQIIQLFLFSQMSELPESIIANKTPQNMSPEMASILENFNKKNSVSPSPTTTTITVPTNGLASRQNLLNSSTNSTSSVSKSSQQVSVQWKFYQSVLTPLLRLELAVRSSYFCSLAS